MKGGRYGLMMTFDPRALGAAYCDQEELKFIAKRFAYMVEAEVASSKFVTSASDLERERLDSRMGGHHLWQ